MLIEPRVVVLGPLRGEEVAPVALKVFNLGGRSATIYGVLSFCAPGGCVGCADPFPVVVAPGESHVLNIEVRGPREPGTPLSLNTEVYTSAGTREVKIESVDIVSGAESP